MQIKSILISSALGTIGGASFVMLMNGFNPRVESPEVAATPTPIQQDQKLHRSLAQSPAVLRENQARLRDPAIPPSKKNQGESIENKSDTIESEGELEEVSPEEALRIVMEQKQEEIDAFDDEQRDDTWAAKAEEHFNEDFSALIAKEETKAKLQSVECHTSRCVVTVNWPNLSIARKEHSRLATATMQENCIVSSFLVRSPDEAEGPFDQEVIYNCRPEKS